MEMIVCMLNLGPIFKLTYILPNCKTFQQSLYVLVSMLAVWLHLKCGLSCVATNQTLTVLGFIVIFGCLLAHSDLYHNYQPVSKPDPPHLPHDVHTAMNTLSLEPVILHLICCMKCFPKYSLASLPQICLQCETPQSWSCGESLWTTKST